jgi:hypothetical protein
MQYALKFENEAKIEGDSQGSTVISKTVQCVTSEITALGLDRMASTI